MINKNYNDGFRKFFSKFEKQYKNASEETKEMLFDIAVEYVEKNRDFVMQYPLVNYWGEIWKDYENEKKKLFLAYNNKEINLYFHIPFCVTKCSYCNFHIVVWNKFKNLYIKKYLKKIENEIDEFLNYVGDFKVKTVFIWWWTPSFLSLDDINFLFTIINKKLKWFFKNDIEITFEWNPDSFNEEKIKKLKKNWVNRLSFWVQTFDEKIIKNINRTYDEKIVYDVIENSKKNWIKNINIDMIYGLPWHNYDIMKSDLIKASNLEITHLTYYPLYYYDESVLSKTWKKQDNIKEIYDFYDEIILTLSKKWFKKYWREYFSKDNLIHNYQNNYVSNGLLYWFWHSAYSFNWEYAFYKEQNLNSYLKNNENIIKQYFYNKEKLDRRLFVLWSRNIKIEKSKIENLEFISKILNLPFDLSLIKEDNDSFRLTSLGLKYQEILSHIIV